MCALWFSLDFDYWEEFNHLEPKFGERFEVTIYNNDMLVYQNQVTYGKSFADVRIGQPILYINSPSTVLVLPSTRDPLPRPIM